MRRGRRSGQLLVLACLALGWLACGAHPPRARRRFGEIERLVAGRTESAVKAILGPPDACAPRLADDEVWIWWDSAVLDDEQFAPELRGMAVHLEITFTRPAGMPGDDPLSHSSWQVAGPFAVNFSRRLVKEVANWGGSACGRDRAADLADRFVLVSAEHYPLWECSQTGERNERSSKGDHRMKKSTKTLNLHRDTLLLLDGRQLTSANGGGTKNTLTGCDGFANSGCPNSCLC
jgi:hypothetical protein